MSILRRVGLRQLKLHRQRRCASVAAAAVRQETTVWTQAPLSEVEPAAESLFHVTIDVSDAPDLASSHTRAGQYLQLRVPDAAKPSFLAIASPPCYAAARGAFEFLVKSVAGSTAEMLCSLKRGDIVELSPVMGRGFDIDRIEPPEAYPTVLIFATGSGISPIRSLIESGFSASKRSDVRLYYGARNLKRMAYQERFKDWESSGVKIVPVLSQPDDSWRGESGYVQAAFNRSKQIYIPQSVGAVLCGQKQMAELLNITRLDCGDMVLFGDDQFRLPLSSVPSNAAKLMEFLTGRYHNSHSRWGVERKDTKELLTNQVASVLLYYCRATVSDLIVPTAEYFSQLGVEQIKPVLGFEHLLWDLSIFFVQMLEQS
ncbi:hypothetical protein CJ030_MR7G017805 [Morella rubra]|uniref:FAD-binding FR-type domain-containing protein n=1 Tax=Morella rubra TaxID=262757 RepID=A0A6A1UZ43_9ROSI|nr:hypothetical protein CJ030_MR7G017805 [Morella rubra]